jgi:hypothetical protein
MESEYFNLDCIGGIIDILLPKKKFFIFFGPKRDRHFGPKRDKYFLEFQYKNAAVGVLRLHKDYASVMNFPFLGEENAQTIEEFIDRLEEEIFGGEDIAKFLQKTQGNLFGRKFLNKVRSGINFYSDYGLVYFNPSGSLNNILKERGNRYSWEETFNDDMKMESAKYVPVRK